MLKLALRNVFRHRARTALTLLAIVFGVAALIVTGGFIQNIFDQLAEAVIHSHSGHLQVARRGFHAEGTRRPAEFLLEDPRPAAEALARIPGVAEVMSRVDFAGLLDNGRADVAVVGEGVEPGPEAKLASYMHILAGRQLAPGDRNAALLGAGVARALRLAPGDHATLVLSTPDGATNTLDVDVVGVFQTFSKDYDNRAIRIPLAAAQEALDTGAVNTLVAMLERTGDTARVAAAARQALQGRDLEVVTWQELNDFYGKTVALYGRQFGVLELIILAMVLLSTVSSVNMSALERVGEFGTMRALGNPASTVFRLVVTEALLLGLFGAALGVAVGAALAAGLSAVGIPMPPPPNADLGYVARVELVPGVVAKAFVVGVLATAGSGLIAAARVARIPLPAALRQAV
jgi:putative ABC transport system permease protein